MEKNKIKKIICVICSSVLIFTLIGCGKAETTDIDNNKTTEEETTEMIQTEEDLKNAEPVSEDDLTEKQKNNVEVLTLFNQMIGTVLNVDVRNEENVTYVKGFLSENADEQTTKKVLKFYDSYDASKNENTTTIKDIVIVKTGITTDPNYYRIDYYLILENDNGKGNDFELGNKEENAVCYIKKSEDGKLKIVQPW